MNARKDEDSKFICSIEVENEQLKTALAAKDAEVLDLRSQIEALNREQEACNAQMIDMDTQIKTTFRQENFTIKSDIHSLEDQLARERHIGVDLK